MFRRWSFALLLFALIGLSLLSLVLNPPRTGGEAFSNRSIYNGEESGYRAWFVTAQKAGLPVSAWRKPFSQLDSLPSPATMVLIEPYTLTGQSISFSPENSIQLLDWVREGNTLILLDDFQRIATGSLLQNLGLPRLKTIKDRPAPGRLRIRRGTLSSELSAFMSRPAETRGAKRFVIPGEASRFVETVLTDRKGAPVMVAFPAGKGRLILGTVSDLGSNRYLRADNDNYQLFSNLVNLGRHPVFINEFVHGYREVSDIFSYYQENTPLGAILLQVGFAFLFGLWLSARRWRPPVRQLPDQSAPAGMLNYIHAVGRLYAGQHAASLALGPQLRRIDQLLARRYRLDGAHADPAAMRDLLTELAADYSSSRDRLVQLWLDSLEQARRIVSEERHADHREVLRLARPLALLETRLQETTHVRP